MAKNKTAAPIPDPRHTFVGIPELMDAPGRWRLDHILAWEEEAASAGSRRGRRTSGRTSAGETAPGSSTDPNEDEGDVLSSSRPSKRKFS